MFDSGILVSRVSFVLSLYSITKLEVRLCVFRHVMREKLPVNISVLCDFVEYICSTLVVTRRSQRTFFLDDVTMPRSWILASCINFKPGYAKDTLLRPEFLETLLLLLARVFKGFQAGGCTMRETVSYRMTHDFIEHLLFGGQNLSVIHGVPKSIAIARM